MQNLVTNVLLLCLFHEQSVIVQMKVDCDLLLNADDSCLVCSNKSVNDIEEKLNENFNSLCDWFVDNKLSINFGEEYQNLYFLEKE